MQSKRNGKTQRRRFTIMVVPHHGAPPWKISLSLVFLSLLSIILAVTFIWAGLSINYYVDYQRTLAENQYLTGRVQYFVHEMASIKEKVETVEKIDQQLRDLLYLKPNEAIMQYPGSGGPTVSDLKQVAAILREDVNPLTRRFREDMEAVKEGIKRRMESFHEIDTFLKRQREIWQATPSIWPTSGRITSRFGWRKGGGFHQGVDIANAPGTPIRATADGEVVLARRSGGYGLLVVVDHGNGFRTRYAHNKKLLIKKGDKVRKGQIIAYMGGTGKSTGTHLHYEVRMAGRPVNPLNYM
ncbi:MAG TPA: M23 family metallopeptidase [Syntrophaceae bacterium]|nr:M23 family metallopeptidase [Syntrophaceae bacterium]